MRKRISAIFLAMTMVLSMAAGSVNVYADEDNRNDCVCGEICGENSVNEDCPVCYENYKDCAAEKEDDGSSVKTYEPDKDEERENDGRSSRQARNGEGTLVDNPVEVPVDDLAFENGTVYGISEEWFREQKNKITENDNTEEDSDFLLYVSVIIPEEIDGEPVKTIAMNAFNNGYTEEKSDNGAMYVQTDDSKDSYLDIGEFSVVSVDMENAENLEKIETQAFQGCSDLDGVIIFPDSLKYIGESFVFGDCTELDGIVWSDNLVSIGENGGGDEGPASSAFARCTDLKFATTKEKYNEAEEAGELDDFTDLTFPESLEFIGKHAFLNAFQPGLELNVVIPESVETVGSEAFYNSVGEMRFSQFIVERTADEGLEGYDYAAFKWVRTGGDGDRECLIIMANEESYNTFRNDSNGLSYVTNAVTYPMKVEFKDESGVVDTQDKLFGQYIKYELDKDTGFWNFNDDYELPSIPGYVEPEPGYKDSVWMMDGNELTVDSKVTDDEAVVSGGGELEDPEVIFKVTAVKRNDDKDTATMKSGQVLRVPANEYSYINIVPEITHPLAGDDVGEIYFWYKWNDSTDERDNESVFEFGRLPKTLRVDNIKESRFGEKYYQLDIDGKEVSSQGWGDPNYNYDETVYKSSDKQYYIKIELYETAENLAYISANDYQWFIDEERDIYDKYKLSTVYDTPEELISGFLKEAFGEKTGIESDNDKYEKLSIEWELKPGTDYTDEPGETNTFVWTASEEEFKELGWTNTNNIPFTGEVNIPNPFEIKFTADGEDVSSVYVVKGKTLKAEDFPSVPSKAGYDAAWSVTEDITGVTENMEVTAEYTPIEYLINYELDGGENDSDNPESYTVEDDLEFKEPSKRGYEFEGWTYGGMTEPEKDLTINAGEVTGDLTLTAHWSRESGGDSGRGGSYSLDNGYFVRYHNGDDTVRDGEYDHGDRVVIRDDVFAAPSGMELAGWSLEEGEDVDYEAGDVLRMPDHSVDLYAVWEETDEVYHKAYMNGYPDGTFGPERTITRAEAAQLLYGLLDDKTGGYSAYFTDVDNGAWYAEAVKVLSSKGIIAGSNGMFEPDRPVTRAEFAAMAARFAGKDGKGVNVFSDVFADEWYYGAVSCAAQNGWISGYPDGTFRPQNSITRAEAVTIVNKMLGRAPDEYYIYSNRYILNRFTDVSEDFWGYYQIIESAAGHYCRPGGDGENWSVTS